MDNLLEELLDIESDENALAELSNGKGDDKDE